MPAAASAVRGERRLLRMRRRADRESADSEDSAFSASSADSATADSCNADETLFQYVSQHAFKTLPDTLLVLTRTHLRLVSDDSQGGRLQ